jgi:hypothetical protein
MGEEFITLGVDAWDGSASQVENIFVGRTGSSYPLLLQGSGVARAYGFDRHNYAVIDHAGILLYRSSGSISRRFDAEAIRAAIGTALMALAAEEEVAIFPDFDNDGKVGFGDFFIFADAFGTMDLHYDLDASGVIDFGYFLFLPITLARRGASRWLGRRREDMREGFFLPA